MIQQKPTLIGYAYLSRSPAPEAVTGPAPLELKRFYIDSPWHGRGVAQALMSEVLRSAVHQGARTLWLGVYEHNARAYAFYRKFGFQRVGEHVVPVGSDPQIDWLLARLLDEAT
jgi:ribosomal protein S18 acetylase RimI-like enzyme